MTDKPGGTSTQTPPMPPTQCGNGLCDAGEDCANCAQDCNMPSGAACPRIGMLLGVWHQPAVAAKAMSDARGATWMTIEDLLRVRQEPIAPQTKQFSNLLLDPNLTSVAWNFYYQHTPQAGFDCFYYPRSPNEMHYNVGGSDDANVFACPNYQAALQRHAEQLTKLGVDYVVADQTNLLDAPGGGDIIALRPFEILAQQWADLRQRGVQTPDIAAWQRLPDVKDANNLYPYILDVYNQDAFDRLIMRDRATGKKIFFYPTTFGIPPSAIIDEVEANGGRHDVITQGIWVGQQDQGIWNFMASCASHTKLDDTPCAQAPTLTSRLGVQLAVSASYQEGPGSDPFGAVGVFGGITLRKQFATAFAMQPNYLFTSGWNEEVAQPQANGTTPAMGLENDASFGSQFFVDTYGVEFSRDIEPTREYGTLIYDIYASCVRVFRSGAASCADTNELCCQGGSFSQSYTYYDGGQGTFGLFAGNPNGDRKPLYLCQASTSDVFLTSDAACEGRTQVQRLGYIASSKSGATLRALYRCFDAGSNQHSYALSGFCPAAQGGVESVLGYVR